MSLSDVVHQLHDKHGLTYTGTTEQSNLSTFHIRLQQVDDFNTCRKDLLVSRKVIKLWRLAVNRVTAFHVEWLHAIDRLSDNVHHTSANLVAWRHLYRCACRYYLHAALQTVGRVHGNTAYGILADVLLHLDNELLTVRTVDSQSIVNLWQHFLRILALGIKVNIDDRADNLGNVSDNLWHKLIFLVLINSYRLIHKQRSKINNLFCHWVNIILHFSII